MAHNDQPILCRIAGAIQRAMVAGDKGGGISTDQAALALAMLSFADCSTGRAWPGEGTLASMLNVTDRTVRRRRQALVEVGLILPIDQRGGRRRLAVYRFNPDWQPGAKSGNPDTNPASLSGFQERKGDTNPASLSGFPTQNPDAEGAKPGRRRGETRTQTPPFCPPNSRTVEQQQSEAPTSTPTPPPPPPSAAAGDQEQVRRELDAAGVGEPKRSELAEMAGVTVELVRSIVENRGNAGPGLLVRRIEEQAQAAAQQARVVDLTSAARAWWAGLTEDEREAEGERLAEARPNLAGRHADSLWAVWCYRRHRQAQGADRPAATAAAT